MNSSNGLSKYGLAVAIGCGSILSVYSLMKHVPKYLWYMKIRRFTQCSVKTIHLVNSMNDWNDECLTFLKRGTEMGVVGLDCEWVSTTDEPNASVSLIQIGLYTGECLLVRLCNMEKIPDALKSFLEDNSIVKAGVSIDVDCLKLMEGHHCAVKSWVDLRFLVARSYDVLGVTPARKRGLKSLAERHLLVQIEPNKTGRSNWNAKQLSTAQIQYAALDANFGVRLLLQFVSDVWDISYIPWNSLPENTTKCAVMDVCYHYFNRKYKDPSCKGNGIESEPTINSDRTNKETQKTNAPKYYSTRKKPLYYNSYLWTPDNVPICTCDPAKAKWYISKGLGDLVSEDPFVVRLRFEPSGTPVGEGQDGRFYLQERSNECVVCGKVDSYIRKNIVPREYRRYFPEFLKAHQSHDVVLLCAGCHQTSNIRGKDIRDMLAVEFDTPIGQHSDILKIDQRLKTVRNSASALINNSALIPEKRKEDLRNIIKEFYRIAEVTPEVVEKASKMDITIKDPAHVNHGLKVVRAYSKVGLIKLEIRFREWFLNSMKPKFLPKDWSVTHNHVKLQFKMNRLQPDDPLRKDYQLALYGIQ